MCKPRCGRLRSRPAKWARSSARRRWMRRGRKVEAFQYIPKDTPMTASTDPFSASIIPFEVPEQMRALAEKGVSQARDSYAKFKDAAETHNGTIEAVFSTASKGASEYSR